MLTELYQTLYADLVSLASVAGVNEKELQEYFVPEGDATSKSILLRLCSSLQNSGMMHNSIKFNDKDAPAYRTAIETVMCGFDAKASAAKYADWTAIYKEIINTGISDNGSRKKKETNWEKYSRGLYDGIQFLTIGNGENIIQQLVSTNMLTDTEIGIIGDISTKIHGLGFTLTCDWLKECGCDWLAKPDGHVKAVIMHLKGVDKIKDKDILREMFSWAEAVKNSGKDSNATTYKLDKIIWLLCTGKFHLDGKRTGRKGIYHKIDSI